MQGEANISAIPTIRNRSDGDIAIQFKLRVWWAARVNLIRQTPYSATPANKNPAEAGSVWALL